jgi:hypothetical protein
VEPHPCSYAGFSIADGLTSGTHAARKKLGCSIQLRTGGETIHIPFLGFIDDLLLLADTPRALQKSLTAVFRWVRTIRTRLNIGADKSAVMVISRQAAAIMRWHLCKVRLPVVDVYKYMGAIIAASGSSGALVESICQKMISRTGELRRWARAILITLDLLARLWGVYVRSSALWCASSCHPNASQQLSLARARRKAARLLLGHRCTSPLPTPCIEMGWPLINTWLQDGRLRLLAHILDCSNSIVQAVAAASLADVSGWLHTEAAYARQLAPEGLRFTSAGWKALSQSSLDSSVAADTEQLIMESSAHPQLASYSPGVLRREGILGINRMIVGRLSCGGQGLRGADAVLSSLPTPRTACIACLVNGLRVKETLQHFVFPCPLTQDVRSHDAVSLYWASGERVLLLHRDVWNFRQLRTIRDALLEMWQCRDRFLRAEGANTNRRREQRVEVLWEEAVLPPS